jgi:alpha-ketoglutarate-dependent taurine dioxygenase
MINEMLLTKYDFSNQLDISSIKKTLTEGKQIVLIENFPEDDQAYESFIVQLGKPVLEPRNNQGKSVCDVKVHQQNNLFTSVARSNLHFPLHSDCADYKDIPNVVALLCVQPAPERQGINTFAALQTILNKLTHTQKKQLLQKKWTFIRQKHSILNYNQEEYSICYDRITMESFANVNDEERDLLDSLDAIFNQCLFEVSLKKGTLALFRNDKFLHGRTSFPLDSDRVLKRIRFYLT